MSNSNQEEASIINDAILEIKRNRWQGVGFHAIYFLLFIMGGVVLWHNMALVDQQGLLITQQGHKTYVELEKIEKHIYSIVESVRLLNNISARDESIIIKNANKFEEIKQIYFIKMSVNTSIPNTISGLENLAHSSNEFIRNYIVSFLTQSKSQIKSNEELINMIDQIMNETKGHESILESNNSISVIKKYLYKLVTIKTSNDFTKEQTLKEKLLYARNAIENGNILAAIDALYLADPHHQLMMELKRDLQIRQELGMLLDNILKGILQDD